MAGSFWTLNANIEKSEEEKRYLTQKMFSSSVRQDILIGADAEVYKKCLVFSARPGIAGIEVKNLGTATVCHLLPTDSKRITEIKTPVYFDSGESDLASVIRIWYYLPIASDGLIKTGLILILSLLVLITVQYFAIKYTNHLFLNPITLASKQLQEKGIAWIQSDESKSLRANSLEAFTFLQTLETLLVNLQNQEIKLSELRMHQALGTLAVQVAHDIRSPLAALRVAVSQADPADKAEDGLIKSAICRITEICDTLTTQYRQPSEDYSNTLHPLALLSEIVTEIISEKRLQLTLNKSPVELVRNKSGETTASFVEKSTELKRVVSNLISNSIEAMPNGGTILLDEFPDPLSTGYTVLKISDDGIGMSPATLSRAKEHGYTFGKESGNGLGLSHAEKSMRNMGGSLDMTSKIGQGTEATLRIPLAFKTTSFCLSVDIQSTNNIAIYDDDASIIKAWKTILEKYDCYNQVRYFQGLKEFETFVANNDISKTVFFIDFDLSIEGKYGIQLIQKLDIGTRAYLVTSHANDPSVVKAAIDIDLKIIPKILIESVKFVTHS